MDSKKKLSQIIGNVKKGNTDKDERLLAQIKKAFSDSESDRAQFVERCNDAYLYYTAQKPFNTLKRTKQNAQTKKDFVEPVLYNAVKAALPQLLDSFTSDDGLAVAFRSRGYRKNPALEKLITYNLNKIFLRDQDGYESLEGLFKTTIITGDSFAKVFVDETTHRETDNLDDWVDLAEYASGLAEGWTIEPPKSFGVDKHGSYKGFEWKEVKQKQKTELGEIEGQPLLLIRGSIPLINTDKKLIVEEVEPNDFWFDSTYGSDFSKCRYLCHRVKTTVGEAKLRGFDPEKLKSADDSDFDTAKLPGLYFSQVNYVEPTGSAGGRIDRNTSVDENERPINLFEHYIYSSIPHKKGETRIYQVIESGGELLRVTEIKRFPFVHGKCEPVQGSFLSRSFYDIAKPFQDVLSLAQRLNIEKGMLTVYPRYRAVKGQYDRGSLQNNEPGAVIEEMQSGAVQYFENYELPQTFALAQQNLKESMVETVAQAASIANSDGGIAQISTNTAYLNLFNEALKGRVLTHNLKRTLVQPLYILIYEVMKDEGFTLYAEDGSTLTGAELPSVYDMIADPSTTYDDYAQNMQRQQVASFVLQAAQYNSPVLTPQNVYNIAKDMLETSDLDSTVYLSDPSQNVDPQAAHEQAEMAAINSELHKVQLETAKVNMRKLAAETFKTEQEAEETVRNGQANRTMKQAEIQARIQQIISEAQNKSEFNQVKAREVEVKNKQVNYDAMLGAHKQAYEINSNRVNGRMS